MTPPDLQVRLLGPPGVSRNGEPVPLPRSRKVRGLLAFLALEPKAVSRSRLCDLFWDVPNDPRGELRWCLSKLRGVLDDEDRRRVVSRGPDLVTLDLSDCRVDALEVLRAAATNVEQASDEQLTEIARLIGGDLLEGEELDAGAELAAWLAARRQQLRAAHVAIVSELSARAPRGSSDAFRHLEAWLRIAPFDQRAHEVVLDALSAAGRAPEAEQHLARAIRSFEKEGLDWKPLRRAWQASREARMTARQLEASAAPALTLVLPAGATTAEPAAPRRRSSIAIMPFSDAPSTAPASSPRVADGVTEDVITRLAKLRALFVIARGTVFALGEQGIGAHEAGRILGVDYVVSGSVRRHDGRLSIVVELAETTLGRIIWTDELGGVADDTFSVLDSIVDRIVAALAEEVESEECRRAILKPPSSLDAWDAYHRGLWHMYRFNGPDNASAEQLFRSSLALDPTFSRAYAGLSFTHFQSAFLHLSPDRERQIELALDAAGQSLAADERDPAAHLAMGRALWLKGSVTESLSVLQRSIELSPNFALGYYSLGFVQSQSGDPRAAIDATDHSRDLSPFDPLQFGMLASRALAHVRLGELDEAARWAVRAAGRPNAHAHILAIAAECLALAHRPDEARELVGRLRKRVPGYGVEDFLRAFRFPAGTEQQFRLAARRIGFDTGTP
jgi:DNA-binding SARP family transcriptional activator